MKKRALKPIVKWAGGKSQLIDEISTRYPDGIGSTIKKYAEPFVGGGAVLLNILAYHDLDEIYISDINAELINMYSKVKTDVDGVIELLYSYQEKYVPMDKENRKKFFYEIRDEFNSMIVSGESKDSLKGAALFIFLNKTCFNGLYRVNKKGLYNVPMGDYKNPMICDEKNLRAVSAALQNVTIVCADFRASEDFIDENTLVYFDPPYRPLSATSNFTSYTESEFDDKAQTELAIYAKRLAAKGVYVILNNSDPKNKNPDDDFFDDLYSGFHIDRVSATRMINSKAEERGKISELIIYNYSKGVTTMIEGGKGGGNTKTGLIFEGKVDLSSFLGRQKGYEVKGDTVFFKGELVARVFKKQGFYRFLNELGIDWKKIISKQLLPDDSIYVIIKNTMYIIECKFQKVPGSVDEKLQTCDFKKKQYQKLLAQANIDVEYVYLLSNWFKDPRYKDVLDYIHSVRCQYYFEYIPLYKLGLPMPEED